MYILCQVNLGLILITCKVFSGRDKKGNELKIYDLYGKIVYLRKANANLEAIKFESFSSGIYILEISHRGVIRLVKN